MTSTTCTMQFTIGDVPFTISDVHIDEISKIALDIASSTNRYDNIEDDSEYDEERIDEERIYEENDEENEQHNDQQIHAPTTPEIIIVDGVSKFKCIHHGCKDNFKTTVELRGHWIRKHMHENWSDLCRPVYSNDQTTIPITKRKWICLRERCSCIRKGGIERDSMASHLALYYQNSPFYDGR